MLRNTPYYLFPFRSLSLPRSHPSPALVQMSAIMLTRLHQTASRGEINTTPFFELEPLERDVPSFHLLPPLLSFLLLPFLSFLPACPPSFLYPSFRHPSLLPSVRPSFTLFPFLPSS